MNLNVVHKAEAIHFLESIPDESVDLIYTDPPFGTGDKQQLNRKSKGVIVSKLSYDDKFEDYVDFLSRHLVHMRRILKQSGTMYLHLDWRWVHYAKVECDKIFGVRNFLNHVVWSYNFGGRGRDRWPQKHDDILVYTKSCGDHLFNWDEIDRIPYAAPELQFVGRSKEEAEKRIATGQVPTDVWSMSIVGTASRERVGYPSQKPLKLVKRVIRASSPHRGLVVDPFAGSGTTAVAALESGRDFLVCDRSEEAINVMKDRLTDSKVEFLG